MKDPLASQQSRIINAMRAAAQPEGQDLRNIAMAGTAQASGQGNYFDIVNKLQTSQAQNAVDQEMGIYNQMKEQAARGDAEAKAVDDAINEIAGGDPKIYTSLLQDLHNDPENVNASNAKLKVMKYAAERGIVPMSVQKDRMSLQKLQSDMQKAAREGSGEDVGATGNIIKKIAAERGIPFSQAAYLYQTGFRGDKQYDQSGNIVPIGGGLETASKFKEAEKTGTLNAEIKADLKKKGIQANNVMDLTKEAKILLPKSSSGMLQAGLTGAAKMAGKSTEASRADARLKVIAAGLTSSVPRMEGPQGVADLLLYKEAAANVANSELPYEDRLAAVDTMETLQQKYIEEKIPEGGNLGTSTNSAPKRLKYNPATGEFE